MKQKKETHAQSHCERSVAIAKLSNCTSDAITTQTSFARNDKRRAFTLAEVLITLAIIGVVAAMTIPTLIANYQQKQTVVKFQKVYSVFKNALELSRVDNGDYQTWTWNHVDGDSSERIEYFLNTYLLPYLKVSKTCFPISEECFPYLDAQTLQGSQIHSITMKDAGFMLSDGTTVWSWSNNSSLFNPHVRFFVDTNGFKKPNVLGKDIFLLFFTSNPAEISSGKKDENGEFALKNTFSYPLGLSIYGEGSSLTLEECLDENTMLGEEVGVNTGSYMACNINSRGELCGLSIKLNNWKIPEGYPKF